MPSNLALGRALQLLTVVVGIGIVGDTPFAFAEPIPMTSLFFNLQGTVCAPDCGRPLNTTYSFSTNNGPTSDPLEVLLGGAGNDALVSGFAEMGHLGVFAEADALAAAPGSGLMLGTADAGFTEPFTISSSLAPGTIVHALAVVGLDGIASVTGDAFRPNSLPGEAGTHAEWFFSAFMQNLSNPSEYVSVCANSIVAGDCLLPPNVPFEASAPFVFNLVVGDVTVITGHVFASATAGAFATTEGAFASSSVAASSVHSAHFYLQPLDDFTLVSGSGHDYSLAASTPSPAVPEPASVLLIGSGLAALVAKQRRASRDAGRNGR